MSNSIEKLAERLLAEVGRYGSCAVAFSAGVDSTVVAKAAQLALGERAVAVTGSSASLAAQELDDARRLAQEIGIRHVILETGEFEDPRYLQNPVNRCYFCKTELYKQVVQRRGELGVETVCNGANVDDLQDYRPGLQAAEEFEVRSPLSDCGMTKQQVRELARHWGLPVWDKPAAPCLSSRVVYGEAVTPERLRMIEDAERYLKQQGFREVRVRYHRGDLARIEVPSDQIARLTEECRESLQQYVQGLGFKFVTVDLAGFRSGSLNALVPLESLGLAKQRPENSDSSRAS